MKIIPIISNVDNRMTIKTHKIGTAIENCNLHSAAAAALALAAATLASAALPLAAAVVALFKLLISPHTMKKMVTHTHKNDSYIV